MSAYSETVLARFGDGADGHDPSSGLLVDANGALYGTTLVGGNYKCGFGCGTVYKLTPSKKGYVKSTIWEFDGLDGLAPSGGLIADEHGALYGTTSLGGTDDYGTVYKLTPSSSGYAEQTLLNFDATGGSGPNGVTLSKDVLYGTTIEGGAHGDAGVAYKLTPSKGGYTEQVIWNFSGGADGNAPDARVIVDKDGAVYSTTGAGGNMPCHCGTVFELTPSKKAYKESVLWNFSDKPHDGAGPDGIVVDAKGTIYGTTVEGGIGRCYNFGRTGCGTVYDLTPARKGYAFKLLWSFKYLSSDGKYPAAAPTLGANGLLYGTTAQGGRYQGSGCVYLSEHGTCGTIYMVNPAKKNRAEKLLWSFGGSATDGINPETPLVIDSSGALYGTTLYGGGDSSCSCGTVFKLSAQR